MRRLVPDRDDSPSAALDPRLAKAPAAAIEALHAATAETARRTVLCLEGALAVPPSFSSADDLAVLQNSVADCRNFVAHLSSRPEAQSRVTPLLHACDHIERLLERCEDRKRIAHLTEVPSLAEEATRVRAGCRDLIDWIADPATHSSPEVRLRDVANRLESDRDQIRHEFVVQAAEGRRGPSDLDHDLDAHRWLRRCAWHLARICQHLVESQDPARSKAAQA
jgi:phosphate:Na+ symporter